MTTWRLFLLLPTVVLLCAGCQSRAANLARVYPEQNAEIEVRNPGLQRDCAIVNGRALYENQIMLGIVNLRSRENQQQTLEYRWTWFDADRVQIQTGSGEQWETVFVKALEEKQVQGRATAPNATEGQFELRYFSGTTHQ